MASGGWRANLGRFRVDGSSDPSVLWVHPQSLRLSVRQSVPSSMIALGYTLTRPSADDTPPPLPAHQPSPRESVPLIRPPLTSPAPACGLALCCTPSTSLHAAPNMRHLHELACQTHWRRFRPSAHPSTAVLPGSASYCAVAGTNMTCTA